MTILQTLNFFSIKSFKIYRQKNSLFSQQKKKNLFKERKSLRGIKRERDWKILLHP